MKQHLLAMAAALCLTAPLHAGKRVANPLGQYSLYRVYLTDKQGTPYSLSRPNEFLSARALERRQRQGLAVDSTDLPLSPLHLRTLQQAGAQVVGGSKWANTALVRLAGKHEEARLTALSGVRRVMRVYTAPDSVDVPKEVPDMKNATAVRPWGTDSMRTYTDRYGTGQRQVTMLHADTLHQLGYEGQGMLIAVTDGGFTNVRRIPLLQNVDIRAMRDYAYPYDGSIEQQDHGTSVLSCMATRYEGTMVGTAPRASYVLLRSEVGHYEMPCEEDFWAQAVEAADSMGCDLLNSSLGYTRFDEPAMSHLYREQNGMTALNSTIASMAASKGLLICNSAGNEGNSAWKRIGMPADARDILTVGAVTSEEEIATFSSVGPAIDGRVKPDVVAMGVADALVRGDGSLKWASGTSFATPVLCGAVACLWQALPQLNALQVMDVVRQSGDRATHPDNIYGYGLPDFRRALQIGRALVAKAADKTQAKAKKGKKK